MATELIRIDVIEHKVGKITEKGKIKKGGTTETRSKTPEEQRMADEKKVARDKAKAEKARQRAIRSAVVYTSMAVRKATQVGGEIVHMQINNSFNRQIFDANMQGDTRKAQILQNQKNIASSRTTMVTTTVNNLASTAAGFAINPVLGAIQLATFVTQFGLDMIQRMQTFNEDMRQYNLNAQRQLAQTEYARKRLLTNTFNNRGYF